MAMATTANTSLAPPQSIEPQLQSNPQPTSVATSPTANATTNDISTTTAKISTSTILPQSHHSVPTATTAAPTHLVATTTTTTTAPPAAVAPTNATTAIATNISASTLRAPASASASTNVPTSTTLPISTDPVKTTNANTTSGILPPTSNPSAISIGTTKPSRNRNKDTNNNNNGGRKCNVKSLDTQQVTPPPTKKRKSRAAIIDSNNLTTPAPQQAPPPQPPPPTTTPKRPRKKKADQVVKTADSNGGSMLTNPTHVPLNVTDPQQLSKTSNAPMGKGPTISNQPTAAKRSRKKKNDQVIKSADSNSGSILATPTNVPLNVTNPQLLSMTSNTPVRMSPTMNNMTTQQHQQSRLMPGISPLDGQDPNNRYFSLTISPYANYDYTNAASLTRPSLSRLFTSSSSIESNRTNTYTDELSKAFEELRENTWSHMSKCILDQAQQFDIPSLIGTLYTLRTENEKLVNKVRDLNLKREQLLAMNARLDLPGPMLTQHLSNTSPTFSAVVSNLANSPKSLPNSSPSPALNKSPLVSSGPSNHIPPGGPLGPSGYLDRSSPLVGVQTPIAGGLNNIKSCISTPSPPIGALMAHTANSRAGLTSVNNPPYVSTMHHQTMNALNPLGHTPPSSSYYPRQ